MAAKYRKRAVENSGNLLLSRTTILILSSFLVAFASRWVDDAPLRFYGLYASCVGILAFIGLECRADLAKQLATSRASNRAADKLMRYAGLHRPVNQASMRLHGAQQG